MTPQIVNGRPACKSDLCDASFRCGELPSIAARLSRDPLPSVQPSGFHRGITASGPENRSFDPGHRARRARVIFCCATDTPQPGHHLSLARLRPFLCGDVMLGRGIDQILSRPSEPRLYETFARSAMDYVRLAEHANGRIPRNVGPAYVWGEALTVLHDRAPSARVINLETAITTSREPWPKGINYRMHPDNVPCLVPAQIDCCVLANNHVLDWGRSGLLETLATLQNVGIRTAGAGRDATEAAAPAVIPLPNGGRLAVHGMASTTSGVPRSWAATANQAGVNLLPDLSVRTASSVANIAQTTWRPGDIMVASVHWGENWGYEIPTEQREFAHALVDNGFTIVHGHSSHHPKGIELYGQGLILYGCGDLINDYEGISGYNEFRGDLSLMYLPQFDGPDCHLVSLDMVPMKIRRFRLERPTDGDATWLCQALARESDRLGTRMVMLANGDYRIDATRR